MNITHLKTTLALCVSLVIAGPPAAARAETGPFLNSVAAYERMTDADVRETEAYTLGVQTVLWGTQFVKAGAGLRKFAQPLPAGIAKPAIDPQAHAYNTWGHAKALLTHEIRLVEAPNTETLYSTAIVDLKDGPVIVEHPDHGGRYFRTSVWSVHGDTYTISQKQDGDSPAPYALVPVGWEGKLPAGVKSIPVRSRLVMLAPHIAVYGADDVKNVDQLQEQYKLIALQDYGKSNRPLQPPNAGEAIRPIVRAGTNTPAELLFFEMLGETLKDMTLRDDEVAFARQLKRIGISQEHGFQIDQLDDATIAGLKRALLDGQSILEHKVRKLAPAQPGGTWFVAKGLTSLDDWLFRGAVGWKYVWGDLNSEIFYPMARIDQLGEPFTGKFAYQLHFPKGQLPASRYWRITLYDLDAFLVDNPIKRYGIGNMAEKLKFNDDGSLTLYIQHQSPGKDKEVNWLPTPADGFSLQMRMYQPDDKMYEGNYILPPVIRN